MNTKEYIANDEIDAARIVLRGHIPSQLCHESALESLYFCIASQAERWEKPSRFVRTLRNLSEEHEGAPYASAAVLHDRQLVNDVAKRTGYRFHHEQRFSAAIERFASRVAAPQWWEEIRDAGELTREKYSDSSSETYTRHLGRKTFSFWHLCLGGQHLLTLDVWVMTALSRMGVAVPEKYIVPQERKNGNQRVRATPQKKDYLAIESAARTLFAQDERFARVGGGVDMALVDSVLWWKGADREQRGQLQLFNGFSSSYLPYHSDKGIMF